MENNYVEVAFSAVVYLTQDWQSFDYNFNYKITINKNFNIKISVKDSEKNAIAGLMKC